MMAADPIVHLSRREHQIARLMAEGLSYSEIAGVIGWTPGSVRVTAHRMAQRLPGNGAPFVRVVRWILLTKGNSGGG
jgi:DNA-binding CsgD family transcriptional regulator